MCVLEEEESWNWWWWLRKSSTSFLNKDAWTKKLCHFWGVVRLRRFHIFRGKRGGGGGGGEEACFTCQLPRKRCSNKPTFSCGAVTDISVTLLSSFSTGNLYQPCSDQTDHHDSAGPAEWRVRAGSVGVVGAGVVVFYK